MEWFKSFGSKVSEPKIPPSNPLQLQRAKHIDALRRGHQSIQEIQRDVEYRLPILLSNGATVFLHIQLPPMFPQEKPIMRVNPAVFHPWVNDQSLIVGCPGLNNFSVHSDLGRVVADVVEEFGAKVPVMRSSAAVTTGQRLLTSVTTAAAGGYTTSQGTQSASSGGAGVSPTSLSTIPSIFNQLNHLTLPDLEHLAQSDEEVAMRLLDCSEVKKLATDREGMCRVNEALARENLARRPEIAEKKKKLLESWEELRQVQERVAAHSARQEKDLEQLTPSSLRLSLQVAVVQAEEQSDDVANLFLAGKMEILEFIEKFVDTRKLHHLRRTKEERLAQSLPQEF